MRTLTFAATPARVRGRIVFVVLVSVLAFTLAYVAGALPTLERAAPAAADAQAALPAALATQLEAPIVAAPADAPTRGPLRVYLVQPLPSENGLPVFRGYVRNDYSSQLSNLRMEITYADGAVATYPIAAALAPGEQRSFEFQGTRADLSMQPKFFFLLSR